MEKILKNKKILLILAGIIIVAIPLSILFVFNSKKENGQRLFLDEASIIIELGDEVSINPVNYLNMVSKDIPKEELTLSSDLLTSDAYLINEDEITVTTKNKEYLDVGNYSMSIKYGKELLEFVIRVVDTTPPEFIEFKEEIVVEQNAVDFDILKFFKASDLSDATISVDEEVDISKVRESEVVIIAKDSYDNKQTKTTTLKIVSIEEAKKEDTITPALDGTIYKSQKLKDYETEKNKPSQNQSGSSSSSSKNNNSNNNSVNNNANNSGNNNNQQTKKDPYYRTDIASMLESKINAYRISNGLSELPITNEAKEEANMRAMQLISNPDEHNSSFGFGENIGYGTAEYSDFFTAWKNSKGHNATLLRESAVAFAVSVVEYNGQWYAIASFRMNY